MQIHSPLHRELELDVIRGIAILLAVGWHFNGAPTGLLLWDTLLTPGSRFGWAGVDLFFALSGFLIGRLIFQEVHKSAHFNYKRFLIRRIFRLWPTVYVFLVLQLAIGDHDWRTYLWQTVFHVQNFTGSTLGHLWSLAVEEQFYIVFGVLCLAFAKKVAGPATLYVLLSIIIICPILRFSAAADGWDSSAIQSQTQFRCDALAFGVLLAYLFVFHLDYFKQLQRPRVLWLLLVCAGTTFLYVTPRTSAVEQATVYSVASLTAASLILFSYRNMLVLRVPFLPKVFAFLGIYSYSMYVWQFTGSRMAALVQKHISWTDGPVLGVVLKYGCAIGVAFVATTLIERPFMVLRDKIMVGESRHTVDKQVASSAAESP
jgi:peptidoglycan/LPS O-acetylase OafA/YrhL